MELPAESDKRGEGQEREREQVPTTFPVNLPVTGGHLGPRSFVGPLHA